MTDGTWNGNSGSVVDRKNQFLLLQSCLSLEEINDINQCGLFIARILVLNCDGWEVKIPHLDRVFALFNRLCIDAFNAVYTFNANY